MIPPPAPACLWQAAMIPAMNGYIQDAMVFIATAVQGADPTSRREAQVVG